PRWRHVPEDARRRTRQEVTGRRRVPARRAVRPGLPSRGQTKRTMHKLADLQQIYSQPLPELMFRAMEVHRAHHEAEDIQRCALLSIKTAGCPGDCGYCAQSAHFDTGVEAPPLLSLYEVKDRAGKARELGATRFCMGTAWREARGGEAFDRVVDMVR